MESWSELSSKPVSSASSPYRPDTLFRSKERVIRLAPVVSDMVYRNVLGLGRRRSRDVRPISGTLKRMRKASNQNGR